MSMSPSSVQKVGKKHWDFQGKEKTDYRFVNAAVKKIAATLKIQQRPTNRPLLVAMTGLLGSGCSSVAKELVKPLGAVILRSDELRAIYLRPQKKEYQAHTLPILHGLVRWIFEQGGNVVLDRDDADGRTKEYFHDVIDAFRARAITIRVISDRDVIIKRLMNTKYDPKHNILTDHIVALRDMVRRTPLHYDWIPKPIPQFVLKKHLTVKPFATIDTSDGKSWKKEVKQIAQNLVT